jgi:hypothetical protein
MAEAGTDGRGAFLTEKVDNLKDLATICFGGRFIVHIMDKSWIEQGFWS